MASKLLEARKNSPEPTNSDEAPPTPLSNATSCGIDVIWTVRAIHQPSAEPTMRPAPIQVYDTMDWSSSVAMIANSMPSPESKLPLRAVSGEPRRRRPRMNSDAATI